MAAKKWSSCNVFQAADDRLQLWQFELKGRRLVPRGGQSLPSGSPVSARVTGQGWRGLVQPRLNIAWLPADCVFLRVVQLPQCPPEELRSMVELQLERLSPVPVHQTAWTVHSLGDAGNAMLSVLVVIARLEAVEMFLGRLEERALFIDRLDVPAVDQLLALQPGGDGAWVFPDLTGVPGKALVGWWFGGVLRHLGLVELPVQGNTGSAVRDQLLQMAWAGEIEGWLTQKPQWHLVAGEETRSVWLEAMSGGLEGEVECSEPPASADLALSCADRSVAGGGLLRGLLPPDRATRYRQQFNDRLWMRGLGAVLVLYVVGVLAYFAVLGVEDWRLGSVQKELKQLSPAYTNALELKATFDVLNDLQELKYAALDCWKLTAEVLPADVVLDGLNFSDGSRLTLNGTAPKEAVDDLIEFSAALRNAKVDGNAVFRADEGEQLSYKDNPRAGGVTWNFSLVLRRSEVR